MLLYFVRRDRGSGVDSSMSSQYTLRLGLAKICRECRVDVSIRHRNVFYQIAPLELIRGDLTEKNISYSKLLTDPKKISKQKS